MFRYETAVPCSIVTGDPDRDGDIDVSFDWDPGTSPSGMDGPPEDYDPGSGEEFSVVLPIVLADDEARIIEYLDANWTRPDPAEFQPDPDRLRDEAIDDRLTETLDRVTPPATTPPRWLR